MSEDRGELRTTSSDVRATFKANERLELIAALDRLVRSYAVIAGDRIDKGPGTAYAQAVRVLQDSRRYL